MSCYETSFDIEALIISYGRKDLESRSCSRGDPLRAAEQILRPLAQSCIAAFDSYVVLGPQDGTSWGTGSGSALNHLTKETLYHLFDSPSRRLLRSDFAQDWAGLE